MADIAQLSQALLNADQAGDAQAARAIASEIQRRRTALTPTTKSGMDQQLTDEHAAFLAAEGTGPVKAAVIAAGRGGSKVLSGIEQLLTSDPERLKQEQRNEDVAYKGLTDAHPVATAVGEAAPYVAVPASAGVVPAAVTVGGTEALKYGTPEERAIRGVSGAGGTAAGGLLAKKVGGLIAPVTNKAAGEANQGALQAAERIGVKPRLSEVTGSSLIARLEDAAARVPGGAGVMAEHTAGNAAAVNRAAAQSIGEVADELTPEVFARAADRIGKVFEAIKTLPGKVIQVQPSVAAAADDVLRQQAKMLPTQQDKELINLAQQAKVWAANRGRIDGETYQLMRSGLSEAAFDASGSNRVLYGKLLEAIDDSADASLRSAGMDALADGLKVARPQYANLKLLEKGATAEAGNVSPAKVASTMRTNNPGAFRRGSVIGPLADVARVGEGMKPLRAGSPTFEREAVSSPLSAVGNMLWSYPVAKATTSPLMTLYPRTIGKTAGARTAAELSQPAVRQAIAAAMQRSGYLPIVPEMAE